MTLLVASGAWHVVLAVCRIAAVGFITGLHYTYKKLSDTVSVESQNLRMDSQNSRE